MPNTNQHVAEPFRGILNHFSTSQILGRPAVAGSFHATPGAIAQNPEISRCECDGELVWGEYPYGWYVKTSHYCPLHDDCECCGEVKGTKKDRTLTVAGRPAWVCDECYLLCDDHGEKDCKICAAAVKPEVWYA